MLFKLVQPQKLVFNMDIIAGNGFPFLPQKLIKCWHSFYFLILVYFSSQGAHLVNVIRLLEPEA